MARTLTHDEAKAFYDRLGRRQDSQAFYEDRATAALIAHGDFAKACAVFEFGCGTGRFAELLLEHHLHEDCSYRAVDVSTTMVDLARRRLARWGDRAEVRQTAGAMDAPAAEASCDRFIACYVLDLLSDDDIRALVAEARRVLVPSGLLCTTGLTPGRGFLARGVMGAWRAVQALNPKLVGGCRPVEVRRYLSEGAWRIRHHEVIVRFGISSEVLVAARL